MRSRSLLENKGQEREVKSWDTLGAEGKRRPGCPGFLVNQSNTEGSEAHGADDPARSSIFSSTKAGKPSRPRRSTRYVEGGESEAQRR